VGCASPSSQFGGNRDHGFVLLLPGSEGRSAFNDRLGRSLVEAEVKSSVELRDWTGDTRGLILYNQLALDRNREAAKEIARGVCEYQDRYPGRPVELVGHSAGAAIALHVAEALPPDRQVDAIYLLGPSMSPGYDLTCALKRTRRTIYSFSSKRDLVLCAGTSMFGTTDHHHTPAAGWSGFETPTSATPETKRLYRKKLIQARWTPDFDELAADGSHMGWTSKGFAAKCLAPVR